MVLLTKRYRRWPLPNPFGKSVLLAAAVTFVNATGVGNQLTPPKINIEAYNGGELIVEGFDVPVVLDFHGLELRATVPLNVDHNTSIDWLLGQGCPSLIGTKLFIPGEILEDNERTRKVLRLNAAGFKWQASVGAIIDDGVRIKAGQTVVINGQPRTGPIIHATKSRLTHCAVLTEGADQTSTVTIAAKAAQSTKGRYMGTFEEWVASLGLDVATLTPDNLAKLQAGFGGTPPVVEAAAVEPPQDAPAPVQAAAVTAAHHTRPNTAFADRMKAEREAEAEELVRVTAIKAACPNHHMIAAKAIKEGKSAEWAELQVLKLDRSGTGATSFKASELGNHSPMVLEAALCRSGKLAGIEKVYDDKTLQSAHAQYPGTIGIQRVLLQAALANGEHINPGKMAASDIRRVLKAAFSTVDLSNVLSNVMNKFLLEGYNSAKGMEKAKRLCGKPKPVGDFKPAKSIRLIDGGEFELIPPTGKIAHGTLTDEAYTISAKTRAKMYKITREDMINDELGFLDQLREMIGMGSARSFLKVFWTEFMDNSAFFTTGRGNYASGGGTALSITALSQAVKLFRLMKTPQNTELDLTPALLLVGPSNEATADTLYTSANITIAGTTDRTTTTDNTHKGKYEPVVVPQLENTLYTGYSTTAFYLTADPSEGIQLMDTCFLDGNESPTVETADADFDELGIQIKGFWDFGVAKKEYRAGVKLAGA